jgi:chromosome segregation ATPase
MDRGSLQEADAKLSTLHSKMDNETKELEALKAEVAKHKEREDELKAKRRKDKELMSKWEEDLQAKQREMELVAINLENERKFREARLAKEEQDRDQFETNLLLQKSQAQELLRQEQFMKMDLKQKEQDIMNLRIQLETERLNNSRTCAIL